MSSPTLATVVTSSGLTVRKPTRPLAVVKCAVAMGSDPKLTNNVMFSIIKALGESFMTWQQVTVIAILVLGGCFLGFSGRETLAATLIGAAAGFVSQPLFKGQSQEKPASLPPPDAA